MNPRSLIQRTCAVLALIALSVYLFYTGKGHTLLLDTNAITVNGRELRAPASATVSIDGQELDAPMGRAERAMVTVSGPGHRILIVDDADSGKKVEKSFTLPTFMDRALVSIPAILGGAPEELWVTAFVPPPLEDAPVERMQRQREDPAPGSDGQNAKGQTAEPPK